jgi:hypothetical protein
VNFKCPYHAKVMNVFEIISSKMVRRIDMQEIMMMIYVNRVDWFC